MGVPSSTTTSSTYNITSKLLHSADGTPIYAEAVGDAAKPSVVFVHGFGLSGIAFDGIFGEGDEGRTAWIDDVYLVRYDTRGHGRSGKPEDVDSWQSTRLGEDFAAVVQGFGLSRPFAACWSLGGLTLTDILNAKPPTYLSGAILLSGYPSVTSVYRTATPHALAMIPPFLSATALSTLQSTALAFIDSFTAPGASRPLPYSLQQALLGNVLCQPRGCTEHVLTRTQDETAFWDAGRAGKLPLLVVNGSEDALVDERACEKMVGGAWAGGEGLLEFVRVDGAGHMTFWERPREVRDVVVRFVRRVSVGRGRA